MPPVAVAPLLWQIGSLLWQGWSTVTSLLWPVLSAVLAPVAGSVDRDAAPVANLVSGYMVSVARLTAFNHRITPVTLTRCTVAYSLRGRTDPLQAGLVKLVQPSSHAVNYRHSRSTARHGGRRRVVGRVSTIGRSQL